MNKVKVWHAWTTTFKTLLKELKHAVQFLELTQDEVHVKQRPINSNTEKISVEHNLPESSREETSVTLRKTWTEQPEGKMGHEKA